MIDRSLTTAAYAFICALSLLATDVCAQEASGEPKTEVIVVQGAAGTDEFGEQFDKWIEDWKAVAEKAGANLTLIGKSSDAKPNDLELLEAAIKTLAEPAARPIWLVFLGHGTYSRQTAKFNLRGPDVSAKQLADWLKPIQRPLVIVNCASSSGPFINQLSGKNRIVVTATKSGTQYNYARFGEYFTRAIASLDSDLDHDDEVSVHEAFLRASADVKQFYDAESRIATEHALIDDNGDGRGTPAKMFRGVRVIAKAKDGAKLDGKYASRITLSPTGAQLPFTDAELKKREALESQLEGLRSKKGTLDTAEYLQKLEQILVDLARIYRAAEGRLAKK